MLVAEPPTLLKEVSGPSRFPLIIIPRRCRQSTRPKLKDALTNATSLVQGLTKKQKHVQKKLGKGQLAFEKLSSKRDQFADEARSATTQLNTVETEQKTIWETLKIEREKLLDMQRKRQEALGKLHELESKSEAARVKSSALAAATNGLRDAAEIALQEQSTLTELLISDELRLRTLWTGEKNARVEDRRHWTSKSENSAIMQARETARAEREVRTSIFSLRWDQARKWV